MGPSHPNRPTLTLLTTLLTTLLAILTHASTPSTQLHHHEISVRQAPGGVIAVEPISKFITFRGQDYAMIDGTDPTTPVSQGQCTRGTYAVPQGWALAPDSAETRGVVISVRFPFGRKCKVVATGKAYEPNMIPSDPDCGHPNMLSTNADSEGRALVSVHPERCAGILITRPSKQSDTWVSRATINNVYVTHNNKITYASLDNTPPRSPYTPANHNASCQDVAMEIPEGWLVGSDQTPDFHQAANQMWGTECSRWDSRGRPCEISILSAPPFYSVGRCDSKVLVYQSHPTCYKWSEWSDCQPDECGNTTRHQVFEKGSNQDACEKVPDQVMPCNCKDDPFTQFADDQGSESQAVPLYPLPDRNYVFWLLIASLFAAPIIYIA